MTPSGTSTISTPFGDLKFEQASSLWFQQNPSYHIEVAIGGGPDGPSENVIKLAKQLLPRVGQLIPAARRYLEAFIKTDGFAAGGEWCFEGLLLDAPPVSSQEQFGLCFVHPGYIYGDWTVVFRILREHERALLKVEAWPISFHREQR